MQAVTAKAALLDRTSIWSKLTDEQKTTIKLPTRAQIEGAYTGEMPKWLYRNLVWYRYPNYYWTSSPADPGISSTNVICVNCTGGIDIYNPDDSTYVAIRPVITLSKTDLQ